MGYTYPIEARAMFEDRASQFEGFGVPAAEIAEVRAAVDDMWRDGAGGWAYEWSKIAARHTAAGEHYLASLLYGCAKFPCQAGQKNRADALAMQVKEYVAAAANFPFRFERRVLQLSFRGGVTSVPVHLYSSNDDLSKTPVLLISGGVDTWKMDIHPLALAFAKMGLTVVAFDQPGTGESSATLSREADEIVLGLVREARALGNGWVAHFGLSFGANFAAMTGLSGAVDAAVVLGGPTDKSFAEANLSRLPYGMFDILGNAMGFEQKPSLGELSSFAQGLSRHDLLEQSKNAPMLVINGADDYFVPQADTLVFTGRRNTQVRLLEGTGHCAVTKMPEVIATSTEWLRTQLANFDSTKRESQVMVEPAEVFDRAIQALLAGDANAYADLFAPDGVVEWPFAADGWPKRLEGRDAIRAHVAGIFTRFQAAGRKLVAARDTIKHSIGTHELAAEFSIEASTPTGAARLPYVNFLRVTNDGQIAVLRDYFRPMPDSAPPAAQKSNATTNSEHLTEVSR